MQRSRDTQARNDIRVSERERSLSHRGAWAASVVGCVGVGAGTIAVFVSDNEIGTAGLLLLGAYMIVAGMTGDFPRLRIGDAEVDPTARRLAREAERLASAAQEDALDAKACLTVNETVAAEEQGALERMDPEIARLAATYRELRYTMNSSPERTARMESVAQEMVARFRDKKPSGLNGLLSAKDQGVRLAGATGVIAWPSESHVEPLVEMIVEPDSAFSEYWAIKALENCLGARPEILSAGARERLASRLASLRQYSDRASALRRLLRT